MENTSRNCKLSKKNITILTLGILSCLAFAWAFEKGQAIGEIFANH